MKVLVRRKEEYQSDDGRQIEVFTKIKEIEAIKDAVDEDAQFSNAEVVYIGSARIPLGNQAREIKFEIPNCKSIEEAFERYYGLAESAAGEFYRILQEKMEQNNSKIEIAGANTLHELDEMEEQTTGSKLII